MTNDRSLLLMTFDLAPLTRLLVSEITPIAQSKDIMLHTELNSVLIRQVSQQLIEAMVTNLFNHAVDHTRQGGTVLIQLKSNQLMVAHMEQVDQQQTKSAGKEEMLFPELKMVKSICHSCHFLLTDEHLGPYRVFTITFPSAM